MQPDKDLPEESSKVILSWPACQIPLGIFLQNTPSLDPRRPLGVLQTEVIGAVNEQSAGDYWMLV